MRRGGPDSHVTRKKRPRFFPARATAALLLFFCTALPVRASGVDAAHLAASVAGAGMTLLAEQQGSTAPGVSAGVVVLAQAAVEPAMLLAAAQAAPVTPEPGPETAPKEAASDAAAAGAAVAETSPAPAAPAASAAAKDSIRLLNSLEFRGALKNMPKWQRVVEAEKKARTFDGDLSKLMRPGLYKQWLQLVERVRGGSVLDKAKAVTAFFNRWPYRTDQEVYKLPDYWATPAEFLSKSGDCEDYAITKFYALMQLGVPPESMRIVALKDTIRNLAHAVLVVYTDNDVFVLDNLTDMVLSHKRYQHYWPQYSVNEVYRWAHVMPKKKK